MSAKAEVLKSRQTKEKKPETKDLRFSWLHMYRGLSYRPG